LNTIRLPRAARKIPVTVCLTFSFAGFRGGGISLPEVPEATRISPSGGDDTARIQQALDKLATLPLCAQWYRGAVILDRGTFHISDTLRVRASGVVLRGSGQDEVGTVKGARLRIDRIAEQDSGDLTSADLYGLDPRADGFTMIGGSLWHQGTEDRRPFVVFFRPAVLLQSQKCLSIEVDVTDYVRRFYQGSQPLVQSIYFRLSLSEARDVRQAGRLEIYNRPVQEEEAGPRPPVLQLWTG
jgi:hypothetical protein